MRTKLLRATASALLAIVAATAVGADTGANPLVGTWVMNATKSKFEPGPPLKAYTFTITDAGGGKLHDRAEWTNGDGSKEQLEYTFSVDGKNSPVTGYANADTVRMQQVKPNETKMTLMKGGKATEWGHYTVSADGKTVHATEGGTDASGMKYKSTLVFDRK